MVLSDYTIYLYIYVSIYLYIYIYVCVCVFCSYLFDVVWVFFVVQNRSRTDSTPLASLEGLLEKILCSLSKSQRFPVIEDVGGKCLHRARQW